MNSKSFENVTLKNKTEQLVKKTHRQPYINGKLRTVEEHNEHMEISVELQNRLTEKFDELFLKYKQCGYTSNQPFQYSIKNPEELDYFNIFAKTNQYENESDYSYIKLDKILNGLVDIIFVYKQILIDKEEKIILESKGIKIEVSKETGEKYYFEFKGYIFLDNFLKKMIPQGPQIDPTISYDELETDLNDLKNKLTKKRKESIDYYKNCIKEIIDELSHNYYDNFFKSMFTSKSYKEKFGVSKKSTKTVWKFISNLGNIYTHSYSNKDIDYKVRVIIYMKLFILTNNNSLIPSLSTMKNNTLGLNEKNLLINFFNILDGQKFLENDFKDKFINKVKSKKINKPTFTLEELEKIKKNLHNKKKRIKNKYNEKGNLDEWF